jgi:hypothetical protein
MLVFLKMINADQRKAAWGRFLSERKEVLFHSAEEIGSRLRSKSAVESIAEARGKFSVLQDNLAAEHLNFKPFKFGRLVFGIFVFVVVPWTLLCIVDVPAQILPAGIALGIVTALVLSLILAWSVNYWREESSRDKLNELRRLGLDPLNYYGGPEWLATIVRISRLRHGASKRVFSEQEWAETVDKLRLDNNYLWDRTSFLEFRKHLAQQVHPELAEYKVLRFIPESWDQNIDVTQLAYLHKQLGGGSSPSHVFSSPVPFTNEATEYAALYKLGLICLGGRSAHLEIHGTNARKFMKLLSTL